MRDFLIYTEWKVVGEEGGGSLARAYLRFSADVSIFENIGKDIAGSTMRIIVGRNISNFLCDCCQGASRTQQKFQRNR